MNSVSSTSTSLAGLDILIVEDDYFVAEECAAIVRSHAGRVRGPVPDVARARASIAELSPDCVVLDLNLKGEMALAFACELVDGGLPLVITTGYDASVLSPELRGVARLQKPIGTRELLSSVLHATLSRAALS